MMKVMTGIILAGMAVQDWRTGRISAGCPLLCIAVGITVRLIEHSLGTVEFLGGLFIGLFVLAAAAVSGGRLGTGDGWVLTACGVCLGWKAVLVLLFTSMFLFTAAGVGGILLKGWSGKKSMPYVPFIWAAFMVNCVLGG